MEREGRRKRKAFEVPLRHTLPATFSLCSRFAQSPASPGGRECVMKHWVESKPVQKELADCVKEMDPISKAAGATEVSPERSSGKTVRMPLPNLATVDWTRRNQSTGCLMPNGQSDAPSQKFEIRRMWLRKLENEQVNEKHGVKFHKICCDTGRHALRSVPWGLATQLVLGSLTGAHFCQHVESKSMAPSSHAVRGSRQPA